MSAVSAPELLVFNPRQAPALISRRRTSRLSLRLDAQGRIRVSAPHHVSQRQISSFIADHHEWLARQRSRSAHSYSSLSGAVLGPRLRIAHRHNAKLSASSRGDELVLTHPEDFSDWAQLYELGRSVIKRCISKQAQSLPNLAAHFAQTYNFHPKLIKTRWMRSRWGSCNQRGVVTLNSQLVRLPDHLIRYVILHELTHLQHQHHQPKFWAALDATIGPTKQLRRELKSYQLWH